MPAKIKSLLLFMPCGYLWFPAHPLAAKTLFDQGLTGGFSDHGTYRQVLYDSVGVIHTMAVVGKIRLCGNQVFLRTFREPFAPSNSHYEIIYLNQSVIN